jgi:hypothetical protein
VGGGKEIGGLHPQSLRHPSPPLGLCRNNCTLLLLLPRQQ